eukprot:SAG31_NODE_14977_length_777_cov_1.594395_2_plen_52_part_01
MVGNRVPAALKLAANLTLVVAVTSTWHADLGGPGQLPLYGRHARGRGNARPF